MPVLILMKTSSGRARLCRLQHAHLLLVVHNNGKTARRDFRQFVGAEKSFEQQNAARIVMLAQRDRGVELEKRESVGVGKRGKDAQSARGHRRWP